MAKRRKDLPRPPAYVLTKERLLESLASIDADRDATARVLEMETDFRGRIGTHLAALPTEHAPLNKFYTNPFVLLFHSFNKGYSRISELEQDILPAKVFSSMETSAGRMVETVVLPVYGWEVVQSEMHSSYSVVDGKNLVGSTLRLATLKSGPRCLNDEMSKDIAEDIIGNCSTWATDAGVSTIHFTYGVLYGTQKQSNKKDWHILRNIAERINGSDMIVRPTGQWHCEFRHSGVTVSVTVRIGVDLWAYIADADERAFVELATALIRACVTPTDAHSTKPEFTISDLADIISLDCVPGGFNVSILQRSQFEWLFFVARHFCDELRDS